MRETGRIPMSAMSQSPMMASFLFSSTIFLYAFLDFAILSIKSLYIVNGRLFCLVLTMADSLLKNTKFKIVHYIKTPITAYGDTFRVELIIIDNGPFGSMKSIFIPKVEDASIITPYYVFVRYHVSAFFYALSDSF